MELRKLSLAGEKNEAPGEDQIVIYMINAGGMVAVKKARELLNNVIKSEPYEQSDNVNI